MTIDTFLFDLDGTLVDSIPDLTKAINLLREELDLSAVTSDEVRGYVGDGVGLLLQRALPEELFNLHRRKRFMEIYTEHLTDETVIYPGILEFLDRHAPRQTDGRSHKQTTTSCRHHRQSSRPGTLL